MQKYNIDFEVGDICNLKFDNKSFDTVVASNVLHLLFNPEIALQEISRVFTDQGKLIAPTFCHGANLRTKILSRFSHFWVKKQKADGAKKALKNLLRTTDLQQPKKST